MFGDNHGRATLQTMTPVRRDDVLAHVREGNSIQAVAMIRQATGASVRDAVDAVRLIQSELGLLHEEQDMSFQAKVIAILSTSVHPFCFQSRRFKITPNTGAPLTADALNMPLQRLADLELVALK